MKNIEEVADFLKLFTNQTRLNIISLLAKSKLRVYQITKKLDISQPSASHHLKVLKKEGLVKSIREGKHTYYSLNKKLFELFDCLSQKFLELHKQFLESTPSSKCRN